MIVITGASGGLGKYLVEGFSKDHDVIGTYHTHKPVTLPRTEFFQLDVTNAKSIEQFVNAVGSKLNHLVLINLAGISIDGVGHKMDESTWDRVVDTNLKGTFLMCRALLPFMRQQEWGRIINVSSIVGEIGIPGTGAYSASKSGIFGLTRTLASENADKNVTVNSLALGYFEAGMISVIKPELQEQIRSKIPMKRFGHPRNLELAVRFLMESDYITGSVININGGLL
jgi:NAD(P)-dependent dehydrogenase (short-subunit alcohol dehydrogenase family)